MSLWPAKRVRSHLTYLPLAALFVASCVIATLSVQRARAAKEPPSPLHGWHSLGAADWRSADGQITGIVRSGGKGGSLVTDVPYQDVGLYFFYRCTAACKPGILLDMKKSGDSMTGMYVSLADGDLGGYNVTLDSESNLIDRSKPEAPPGRGGRGAGGAGGGRGPTLGGPTSAGYADVPGVDIPTGTLKPSVVSNDWNLVELHLYNGQLSVLLNGNTVATGLGGPGVGFGSTFSSPDRIGSQPPVGDLGLVAVHVEGDPGAEIQMKDFEFLDHTEVITPVERLSNRFRMQRLSNFHYGDAIAVGDLNHDGIPDLVVGPLYYLGPDYRVAREIDIAKPFDPTDYGRIQGMEVADFTGDGWDDVLAIGMLNGSPAYLYVNPRGEHRRWDRYPVIPSVPSELFALHDIDGDGKPEFIYGADGYINYAKPDPADPTKPWQIHHISEKGPWGALYAHGLGVGDINGDGLADVVSTWGWWEHPKQLTDRPWTYHPTAFGRRGGTQGGAGGSQMYVYDVNGDGLPDIVTSLEAHGYGLAWYEQQRDQHGEISFIEHIIMDKDPDQSHGVVFTELHGLQLADVDGDGLKDIITGKNKWAHYGYGDAGGDVEPVLYWFKLVRKPNHQVEFIPHMIHNASGIGREIVAADLNNDGTLDIANETRIGTFIFFGKKSANDGLSDVVWGPAH